MESFSIWCGDDAEDGVDMTMRCSGYHEVGANHAGNEFQFEKSFIM
jgi:hypothetical protein